MSERFQGTVAFLRSVFRKSRSRSFRQGSKKTNGRPPGGSRRPLNSVCTVSGGVLFRLSGNKNGGERGIRTPGGLPLVGFQDRCLKPLDHLSAHAPGVRSWEADAEGKIRYSKKRKNQGACGKKQGNMLWMDDCRTTRNMPRFVRCVRLLTVVTGNTPAFFLVFHLKFD